MPPPTPATSDSGRAAFLTRAVSGILFAVFAASLSSAQSAVEDPLPLKRVQIPASRLPLELERARQGVLVQMPRKEFEGKVREAAEATEASKKAPRLLRASYAAEFDGKRALVGRRGHWSVVNPGAGPALLPVGDLNLALANFKTDEARPGILAELDGKAVHLLVEKRGLQEFYFDWTLGGTLSASGLRFELRTPPSPLASLELKTPADYQVLAPQGGVMVTAVSDGKKGADREWLLHFSGSSRVEFILRKGASTDLPPLILTETDATQELGPQRLLAHFDFQVEVLHQPVSRLIFDCDPELQPVRVGPLSLDAKTRSVDIEKWEFTEGRSAAENAVEPAASVPGKLTVHLRAPFQGGPAGLRLSCVADLPDHRTWVSPAIRLRQSSSRGERLKLVLLPDMVLERWDPGTFQLQSGGFDAEGKQSLSLTSRGEVVGQRPRGRVKSQSAEFSTSQHTWWQVGIEKSSLTTEIGYHLAHGRLFQLGLRLPQGGKGWRVESVEMEPKDLLRQWAPAGPLLLIDLERPLTPRTPAKLRVRLQSNQPISPVEATTLDVPDVEPAERCTRAGRVAISADPRFQTMILKPSVAAATPEREGPWSPELPAHFFAFRGQRVTAQLRLTPHPPRVQVRSHASVEVLPRGASLRVRFDMETLLGSPSSVVMFVPDPPGERWKWKAENNTIVSVERLAGMDAAPLLLGVGAPAGPGGVFRQAMLPRGQHWRITLARPLRGKETILAETHLDPVVLRGRPEQDWRVPVPIVVQADRQEGEIHVQFRGTSLDRTSSQALTFGSLDPKKSGGRGDSERRMRFAWQPGNPYPRLTLTTQTTAPSPAVELCDRGHWTTYVEPGKPVQHHLRFLAWNWQRQALPVLLPQGMRVLAAQIDGRWIQPIPQQGMADGLQVIFPAPGGEGLHEYELVYQSAETVPAFVPWFREEAAAPQLPIPPARWHRTWRLAPGLVPLGDGALQRVLPDQDQSLRQTLLHMWTRADQVLEELVVSGPEDGAPAQRALVLAAEAALRQQGNLDATLGELLDRLAVDHLKEQTPLIVDLAALRAAGLGPRTRLSATLSGNERLPFWEGFGLVHVPCRTGALLTTRQALAQWQGSDRSPAAFAAAYEAAVAEAVRAGRDASGRFGTVEQFVETAAEDGVSRPSLEQLLPDALAPDWTAWEPLPQTDPGAGLLVVSPAAVRLAAVILALTLVALAVSVAGRLTAVWRMRLILVWLAAAVLGHIWLPSALRPLALAVIVAAIVAFLLCLRSPRPAKAGTVVRETRPSDLAKAASTASAVVLVLGLLAVLGLPARAQAPESHTVLLLPEPDAEGDAQMVLVTPDLLKRLEDLRMRGVSSLRQAAVISAGYKGNLTEEGAEFTAVFQLYAFADNVALLLPLAPVDLREKVFLDGRQVFPTALPAPQQGYSLTVPSKGLHRLELSFFVRLAAGGEELRFAIPKVAQTEVELALPREFQSVLIANAHAQDDLGIDGKTRTARARLGRQANVAVQWRRDSRPALAADVQLAEAYFWDLRAPAPTLTGILNYTVSKGLVSQLSVLLPEGIETRSVEVNEPGLLGGSRLKAWTVQKKGTDRLVRLELLQPSSGRLQVRLGLIPRFGKAADALLLRLPVPQGVKAAQGVLAYRLEGYEIEEKPLSLGVTSISPDAFVKVWQASEPGKVVPTRAYSFRRATPAAALLLSVKAARPQAACRLLWQVHPHHADFTATVQWTSPREDVLLNVDVPDGATLTAIEGPAVRQWTRMDSRVQIWLDNPVQEATVQLRGYVKHAQKLAPAKVGRFVVPAFRFPRASEKPGPVQLVPAPGLGMEVEQLRGMARSPAHGPAGAWTLTPSASDYQAVMRLTSTPQSADARVLTRLESRDDRIVLVSRLDYWIPHGELRSFSVQLRNWPADDVRLEVSVPVEKSERRQTANGYAWTITLPPGETRTVTVKIFGQVPQSKTGPISVPEVSMTGAHLMDQYIALVGQDLQPTEPMGLERVKDLVQALRAWPGEVDALKQEAVVWRVKDASWRLLARPKASVVGSSVQVLLAERESAPAAERRWIHQARFLVYATPATSLAIRLPAGARPLAVAVNGRLIPPQTPNDDRVVIPLAAAAPTHVVHVQWNYPPEHEPFDRPRLANAVVENAQGVAVVARIHLPPKTEPTAPGLVDVVPARIDRSARRAAAYLQLSRLLADPSPSGAESAKALLAAQKQFAAHYRLATYKLSLAAKAGYDVQPLRKRLQALRLENRLLAEERRFDALRQQAEREPAGVTPPHAFFTLVQTGQFIYTADVAAPLELTPLASKDLQEATVLSQLVLVLLLLLLVASCFPRLWFLVGALWPEQISLLAVLGLFLLGPSLVGGAILLLGISARLVIVSLWLRKRLALTSRAGSSITGSA